jgi:hypothetical protein
MNAKKTNKVPTVDDFKEVMRNGMIENFKNDGFLAPFVFFLADNQPHITQIPNDMLKSTAGKVALAGNIKELCKSPEVHACGIIIEAYGAKMDGEDAKKVFGGVVRVSELDEKQNIIIMIFSTPEKDESFSYVVDSKNKTVGEEFLQDTDGMGGIFGNFFELRNEK